MFDAFNRAGYQDPLLKLLASFLDHYKASDLTEEELRGRVATREDRPRCEAFLDLFFPMLHAYEANKAARGEVDFHDMIHLSATMVRQGAYTSKFRYILVDEFQDISLARARLVQAIRAQVPGCRLFCVGDDWQSIFRFAGGDLSLMTAFSDHFGFTRTTTLDVTYRFNDRISAVSSRFVLKNPAQLQKSLRTQHTATAPAVFVHRVPAQGEPLPAILAEIDAAATDGTTVFVLARYKDVLPKAGDQRALRRQFPRLQVDFLTAHSSKGKEADYVVVVGLQDGFYGFPSQIVDDPLLNVALATPDHYPHGEERRLFYVAVTRARHAVHIVAAAGKPSCFVNELLQYEGTEIIACQEESQEVVSCPECREGNLVGKDGKNGPFLACSNYPYCLYTEDYCNECRQGRMLRRDGMTICETCGHQMQVCPRCGLGRLALVSGRGGSFLRCTMYRSEVSPCEQNGTRHVKHRLDPRRATRPEYPMESPF